MAQNKDNIELIKSVGLLGSSDKMAEVAKLIILARRRLTRVLVVGELGVEKQSVVRSILKPFDGGERKIVMIESSIYEKNPKGFMDFHFGGNAWNRPFPKFRNSRPDPKASLDESCVWLNRIDLLPSESQYVLRDVFDFDRQLKCKIVATAWPSSLEHMRQGKGLVEGLYDNFIQVIRIPPLRERLEDLDQIVPMLFQRNAEVHNKPRRWDQSLIDALKRHSWTRNMNELSTFIWNTIEDTKPSDVIDGRLAQMEFNRRSKMHPAEYGYLV